MSDIAKALEAFSLSILQSVGQVLKKLNENNVSLNEFYEWLEVRKNEVVTLNPGRLVRKAKRVRKPIGDDCLGCGKKVR